MKTPRQSQHRLQAAEAPRSVWENSSFLVLVILHGTFQGPSRETILKNALEVPEHSLHCVGLKDPQPGLNHIFLLSCFEGMTLPEKNHSSVRASMIENS